MSSASSSSVFGTASHVLDMQRSNQSDQGSRSASQVGSQRSENAASVSDTPVVTQMSNVTTTVTLALAGNVSSSSRAVHCVADTRTVTAVTSAIPPVHVQQSVVRPGFSLDADQTRRTTSGMALRDGKKLPPVAPPGAVGALFSGGLARRPNPTTPIPTVHGRGVGLTTPRRVLLRPSQPGGGTVRTPHTPHKHVPRPQGAEAPDTQTTGRTRPVQRPPPGSEVLPSYLIGSPTTVRKQIRAHELEQGVENLEVLPPQDSVERIGYVPVVQMDNIEPHDSASNVTPNRSLPAQTDLDGDLVVPVASVPQREVVDKWLNGQGTSAPNHRPPGDDPNGQAQDRGPPLPTPEELIEQLVREKRQMAEENQRLADLNRQHVIEGNHYATELVRAVKQNDQYVQENELLRAQPSALRVNGLAPDNPQPRGVSREEMPPPPPPSHVASVRSVRSTRSQAFSVVSSTRLNNMIRNGLKDAMAAGVEKGRQIRDRSPLGSQPPNKRHHRSDSQTVVPETPEYAVSNDHQSRPSSRTSSVQSNSHVQSGGQRSAANAPNCIDSHGPPAREIRPNGSGECTAPPQMYPNNGVYSAPGSAPYMTAYTVPPPPCMAPAMAQYPSPTVNTVGSSSASAAMPQPTAATVKDSTPTPVETSTGKDSGPKLREYAGGKESWDVYSIHLNTVKRLNGWSKPRALDQLCAKLKGDASKFYATLPKDKWEDYDFVVENMARRFPEIQSASAARLRLEKLQQKSDQTLENLAQEVNTLGYAAFPSSAPEWVETECVRAFLRSVADKQMAVTVAAGEHKRMCDVLQAAIKYHDASQDFGPGKPRTVRQVLVEVSELEPSSKEDEVLVEKVRQMTSADRSTRQDTQKASTKQPTNGTGRSQGNQNAQNQNQNRSGNQNRQNNQPGKVMPAPSGKPNRPCLICGQNGHWAQACDMHPSHWSQSVKTAYEGSKQQSAPATQPTAQQTVPVNQAAMPTAPWPQMTPVPCMYMTQPQPAPTGNQSGQGNSQNKAGNGNRGRRPNNKKRGTGNNGNNQAHQDSSDGQNRGGNNNNNSNKSAKPSTSQSASSGNNQGNGQ